MYRVEKFAPSECPKCRQKFKKEGKDWTTLLGYIINGKKVMRQDGYPVIICSKCNNHTIIVRLESYQFSDSKAARRLLKQDFVNFQKVEAFGRVEDNHIKYV